MARSNEELIAELKEKGVLEYPGLVKAFRAVDRARFVPANIRQFAYDDSALPIGYGQTISQPYTVAFMLQELAPEPGHKVFEVGYGSGWQTALLASLVSADGEVIALEINEELCSIGRLNLEQYPELFGRIKLFCRDASGGFEDEAPFDRIIAAAEVKEVPEAWREQLIVGGKMIYPRPGELCVEVKGIDGFSSKSYSGFAFVPFT